MPYALKMDTGNTSNTGVWSIYFVKEELKESVFSRAI